MNKKILFIWNYFYFPWEKGKSRFSDLAEALVNSGYELEVLCSSFYHMGKTRRGVKDPRLCQLPYKVSFVGEPGYEKNVSLARVKSIHTFNKGVTHFLKGHEHVDFAYVPVPSCKTALIVKKWCMQTGAKLIIDIEDLWPESFQMIIRPRWLCRLLTFPLRIQANNAYRSADGIVAVSKTYLNRALCVRKDKPLGIVAPIGSDFEYVQTLREKKIDYKKPAGEFWVAYIGTLGSSYDIEMLMDACQRVYHNGHKELVLIILGSGPDEEKLKDHAHGLNVPVRFYGLVKYEEMMDVLFETDLGVNPIVKGSVASLINKVGDYAVSGVPVLNSQDCEEYCELLEKYGAGVSVPPSYLVAFAGTLEDILDHKDRLSEMKKGSLKLGREALSRQESQRRIIALFNSLGKGK